MLNGVIDLRRERRRELEKSTTTTNNTNTAAEQQHQQKHYHHNRTDNIIDRDDGLKAGELLNREENQQQHQQKTNNNNNNIKTLYNYNNNFEVNKNEDKKDGFVDSYSEPNKKEERWINNTQQSQNQNRGQRNNNDCIIKTIVINDNDTLLTCSDNNSSQNNDSSHLISSSSSSEETISSSDLSRKNTLLTAEASGPLSDTTPEEKLLEKTSEREELEKEYKLHYLQQQQRPFHRSKSLNDLYNLILGNEKEKNNEEGNNIVTQPQLRRAQSMDIIRGRGTSNNNPFRRTSSPRIKETNLDELMRTLQLQNNNLSLIHI